MGKVKKLMIKMVSTAGTGYAYVYQKTPSMVRNQIKLQLRKYDPIVRQHVMFTETRISRAKKGPNKKKR